MAILTLSRWIVFQCAHHLPEMPAGHKCRRVHGHTYRLTITCRGVVCEDGLVFDNALIDEVLLRLHRQLDHRDLNEAGLPFSANPTAERLLVWVYSVCRAVPTVGTFLHRIDLAEGDRSTFSLCAQDWEDGDSVAGESEGS